MEEEYQIVYEDKPGEAAWGIIGQGVGAFNEEQAGDDSSELLCFVLKSVEGEIVGGLVGSTHWDWFNVDLLWVREDLRRQGYGYKLITKAREGSFPVERIAWQKRSAAAGRRCPGKANTTAKRPRWVTWPLILNCGTPMARTL